MVVQHNISALNAHRQLGINNSGTSKNLEKLSSGFRVNRAGDDAAGLAISEKMRGQIRGLAMAEQNSANGISLIQTAEGGLNETHAILQRMRELAVQSSNGTFKNEVDRENLDKEVEALKSEIDRIATSTHYNGIKLLDGTMGGQQVRKQSADGKIEEIKAASAAVAAGFKADVKLEAPDGDNALDATELKELFGGKDGVITVTRDENGSITSVALQVGDKTYMASSTSGEVTFNNADGKSVAKMDIDDSIATELNGSSITGGSTVSFTFGEDGTVDLQEEDSGFLFAGKNSQLTFQIGANGGADQRVGLHVDNMSSGAIGTVGGQKVAEISIATRELANEAITVIDDAINQVSSTRADLGALQNRLEHTLNNLGVTKENLTAAESSIRDVDMAKEMMEFTKNNILVQASQSMLAQANQLPQGVLSLLR